MYNFKIGDYVNFDDFSDQIDVPLSDLTYVPRVNVSGEDYRRIVRFELSPDSLFGELNYDYMINEDNMHLSVEDILVALKTINDTDPSQAELQSYYMFLFVESERNADNENISKYERSVINFLVSYICYCSGDWAESVDIPPQFYGSEKRGCGAIIEVCEIFISDKDKPSLEKRYPIFFMEEHVKALFKREKMNIASECDLSLYRIFAVKLAEQKNPLGLYAVGCGCYGGDAAFKCDWERSRDCIMSLFEVTEDSEERAFAANTLGYIYYYGRCNDGVPDYQTAYKYFSFAAFSGVYEAKYKVADMLASGNGVVKSIEAAENIVCELYGKNIEHFRDGVYDCKLADVALRMGWMALFYYMQAELAIRIRMKRFDYFGDSKVNESIQAALTEAKKGFKFDSRSALRCCMADVIREELKYGRLDLVIKKVKGKKTYKFTFSPSSNYTSRRMLITLPSADICGFYDKISFIYKSEKGIRKNMLNKKLVIDEIVHNFYVSGGKVVFVEDGDALRVEVGKKDAEHRFASVSFSGGQKLYDYLCDDERIQPGDTVRVLGGRTEKEVLVCNTFVALESELRWPVKFYKKVLEKVVDED